MAEPQTRLLPGRQVGGTVPDHVDVNVGDVVTCYAKLLGVGRTSMTLKVEAWAQRYLQNLMEKVTDAGFAVRA